jgi:TRP-interacting helix
METSNRPTSPTPSSPARNYYTRHDSVDYSVEEADKTLLKIARIIGVCLYIFAVSFLALALSTYYIFFWNSVPSKMIRSHHLIDDGGEEDV